MEQQKYDCVWDALVDDPAEAAILRIQGELISKLRRYIKENNLTQMQAAKVFGVAQPRISDLKNGKLEGLGITTLISMATNAKFEIKFEIEEKIKEVA